MGVLSRLWQWAALKAVESLPPEMRGVVGLGYRPWDELYGKETDRDYSKLIRRYVSWVYACATINAQTVASVPLRLYAVKGSSKTTFKVPTRKVDAATKAYLAGSPTLQAKMRKAIDVEEVLEHPFLDLLQNVNPFMNQFGLLENWVLFQELTGNCYTLVIKNEQLGIPEQLWILPAQHVRIVPSKEFFIKGYLYGRDPYDMQKFEPDQIIHMKYANPADMFYGVGPLSAAALAVDSHQGMSTHEYTLLQNYAVPPGALATDEQLQDTQVEKLKKEWNAAYRGPNKAGKMAILQGGLKFQPIALSPRDMGFLMGRKLTREEIAAVFRVPMALVTMEDVKAAPATGMIVGSTNYARHAIRPKCRRIEEKLNEQLMPIYDPKLFVAFDNPVPEDKEFFLKEREANLKIGYTTINEERLADNRQPVEWGDIPLVPSNLVPLGTQVPQAGQGEKPSPITDEEEAFSPSLRGRGASTALASESKLNMPGELPRLEATLRVVVQKWFDRYRDYVLENIPQTRTVAKAGDADFFLPPEGEMMRELAANAADPMKGLVVTGAKLAKATHGVGVSLELGDLPKWPQLQEFIKDHTYKFSFSTTKTTKDALSASMQEGLEAGESMFELRNRVSRLMADKKKWEAERIARTESARAMSAGAEASWIADETVDAKEWNGAGDMCEFCQAMNAQFGPGTGGIPLGSSFVPQGQKLEGVSGGSLGTDYSAIEYPPLHPNCRCDLLPVVHMAEEPIQED